MTYERQGLLLPARPEAAHDEAVYSSFHEIRKDPESTIGDAFRETYARLGVPTERKKAITDAWHNGEDADLSATHLDQEALTRQLQQFQEWKEDLLTWDEVEPAVRDAYVWRIDEDIANVRMLLASANGDMDAFRELNKAIYGEVDEHTYRGALDWIANDADMLLAIPDQHPAIIAAADRVKQLLEGKRGYRELLTPDREVFETVRDDHWRSGGYYALLLAGVELPHQKISQDVGNPILEHVITDNLESSYTVSDAPSTSWSVSHTDETVNKPATYNMPWQRFLGLGLGHEIGSHLLERVNGLRGPIKLAADGLDRYEAGNEGRAVIREQVTYDTFDVFGGIVRWRDILRRDIAIGYGMGVGEDGPRRSSEVHGFMSIIDEMYQIKATPDDVDTARQKAQNKTDALLLRALKGTDGQGGAYLKDKVYLEGNVACWLTASLKGPNAISEGDLGKFDINNPSHIKLLQHYGLLPIMDM